MTASIFFIEQSIKIQTVQRRNMFALRQNASLISLQLLTWLKEMLTERERTSPGFSAARERFQKENARAGQITVHKAAVFRLSGECRWRRGKPVSIAIIIARLAAKIKRQGLTGDSFVAGMKHTTGL
jgi:hypothetical protein